MEIVRYRKPFDVDAHVLAMWLIYCRAPRKMSPDVDGHFDLGDIGEAPEKNWERLTPYSPAHPENCESESMRRHTPGLRTQSRVLQPSSD